MFFGLRSAVASTAGLSGFEVRPVGAEIAGAGA